MPVVVGVFMGSVHPVGLEPAARPAAAEHRDAGPVLPDDPTPLWRNCADPLAPNTISKAGTCMDDFGEKPRSRYWRT